MSRVRTAPVQFQGRQSHRAKSGFTLAVEITHEVLEDDDRVLVTARLPQAEPGPVERLVSKPWETATILAELRELLADQ